MKKLLIAVLALALTASSAFAEGNKVKTRLDHLSGTTLVLVISYLPTEIVWIGCDKWKLLGTNSYDHQNDFTIPAANNGTFASLAILDSKGFEGYCATEGSLKAHTDDGNFIGVLDGGLGNWKDSTTLTFSPAK